MTSTFNETRQLLNSQTKKMDRIKLLNTIFSEFQQITQWLPLSIGAAHKNMNRATLLIEMLETKDCGSIGGFDVNNKVIKNESGFALYDRYLALVRKYNDKVNIKKNCGFDLEDLRLYYIVLSKLRDKIEQIKEFNKLVIVAKTIESTNPSLIDVRLLIENLPVEDADNLLKWYDAEKKRIQENVND